MFIEPFAGGAIASLTAVMDGFTDRAVLCEKDPDIAHLWRCVLGNAEQLALSVERFEATPESVRAALDDPDRSPVNLAFRTLLRNRINRGGILAKGASVMNQGENGNGLASRWYPKTLAARIRAIGRYGDQIDFLEGDGLSLIEISKNDERAAFFSDPPYTASGKRAGRRLYTYNDIDHTELFRQMSKVRGPFMMTYDESPEVVAMAQENGFHVSKMPMKNTHHDILYELLITSTEIST